MMEIIVEPTDDPGTKEYAFLTGKQSVFPDAELQFSNELEARKAGFYIAAKLLALPQVAKVGIIPLDGIDAVSVTLKTGNTWDPVSPEEAAQPSENGKRTLLQSRQASVSKTIHNLLLGHIKSNSLSYENPLITKVPTLSMARDFWAAVQHPIKEKLSSDLGGFSVTRVDPEKRTIFGKLTGDCATQCVETTPTGTIQTIFGIFYKQWPGMGLALDKGMA